MHKEAPQRPDKKTLSYYDHDRLRSYFVDNNFLTNEEWEDWYSSHTEYTHNGAYEIFLFYKDYDGQSEFEQRVVRIDTIILSLIPDLIDTPIHVYW